MTGDGKERRVISQVNLCDDYFDRLVIETSRQISQTSHLELDNLLGTPRESPNTSCDNSQEVFGAAGSWSGNEHRQSLTNGQPKRPMNAFMVWGQIIRRELHQRYSNVQNALLSKALGRIWRTMEASEKEPYMRRANLIKANHKREYPNYRYQPRRIQERRNNDQRSNLLIGINLNHPVNHSHPPSESVAHDDLRVVLAQPPVAGGQQQQMHQHQVMYDNQQQQQAKCGKFVRRNSVQTFEYYPYPLTAAAAAATNSNPNLEQQFNSNNSSSSSNNNNSSYSQCNDYSCGHHNSYHNHQHQHQHQLQLQQQSPTQLLQPEPTVVYQSYQQFAYGNGNQNNSRQYHQHQALALAYNEQRSHHQGYGS